jgi:hypothetical protein
MLLVGVFITFLKGFFFGVLAKEFDSAPVHPLRSPPSFFQLISEQVRSIIVFNGKDFDY